MSVNLASSSLVPTAHLRSAEIFSMADVVDIPYAKAVDWLTERRIITSSWQKSLRIAHAKLTAALEAERPPVAAVDTLLPAGRTQHATTYFDCVKVLGALKEAGLDEKSFLGAYTNPHTARWAEVVKKFESGGVYLVDAANYLVHGCAYELPALKKEIARAERELAELQRRQAEYTRLAEASRTRFVQACAKRQIAPEESAAGLKDELRLSVVQLRPLYDKVARRVQEAPLPSAVDEYKALVAYALEKVEDASVTPADPGARAGGVGKEGGGKSKGGKKGKGGGKKAAAGADGDDDAGFEAVDVVEASGERGDPSALLPLISRVLAIDVSNVDLSAMAIVGSGGGGGGGGGGGAVEIDWGGGGAGAVVEVDWGGSGGGDAGVAEVDWGGSGEAATGDGAAVNWGIEEDDSTGGGGAAVSWDFGVGEGGGGSGVDLSDFGFEVEESGEATSAEEQTLAAVFEQTETRNHFLDDLFELQAFLTQYQAERSTGGGTSALPNEMQACNLPRSPTPRPAIISRLCST